MTHSGQHEGQRVRSEISIVSVVKGGRKSSRTHVTMYYVKALTLSYSLISKPLLGPLPDSPLLHSEPADLTFCLISVCVTCLYFCPADSLLVQHSHLLENHCQNKKCLEWNRNSYNPPSPPILLPIRHCWELAFWICNVQSRTLGHPAIKANDCIADSSGA